MRKAQLHPDAIAYNALISALEKGKLFDDAFAVFAEMQASDSVAPDLQSFSIILSAYAKSGMADEALSLYEEMKVALAPPTPTSTVGHGEGEEMKLPLDVMVYNPLISVCQKAERNEDAFRVFEEMQRLGVAPDAFTYFIMMAVCEQCGRAEDAFALFNEMKLKEVQPGRMAYGALISACVKGDRLEEAFDAFTEMKKSGVQPNVTTYNGILFACEKSGRPDKAMLFFDEMKNARVTPDVITYTHLIGALDLKKRHLEIAQVFEEAVSCGIFEAASSFAGDEVKIDLHSSSASVARAAVTHALEKHIPNGKRLQIVTGQGIHSDGEAVVKPAIIEMLERPKYRALEARVSETNPGRIVILGSCFQKWRARIDAGIFVARNPEEPRFALKQD
jgi:pentatricopeptide repeat domain-containing protein 1